MEYQPLHFIGEAIEAQFDEPPLYAKRPGCPNRFVWRGTVYEIVELLSEWQDYERRGRMAHNMRPAHAAAAASRGSWGVGRSYFRVRVATGQIFDLYYDRAPESSTVRAGSWLLYRELAALPENPGMPEGVTTPKIAN